MAVLQGNGALCELKMAELKMTGCALKATEQQPRTVKLGGLIENPQHVLQLAH